MFIKNFDFKSEECDVKCNRWNRVPLTKIWIHPQHYDKRVPQSKCIDL